MGGVGRGRAPRARARVLPDQSARPPCTETTAGGRGLRRAPALGGLWDSGGRRRASEGLDPTAEPGDAAGAGTGWWRRWASGPSAAAQHCGLLELRGGRFPPGLGFAAGRYPGRPGRLPCRGSARAGRATPLTSRGPRAAQRPARTQPARTPNSATRCARALRRPESACARPRRPPPLLTGPLNRAGAARGGAGGAPR